MTAVLASEARKNLLDLIQRVNDDQIAIEIVSKRGNAVLVSVEMWESWQETEYLLRNPVNARQILDAVEAVQRGEVEQHDLIEEIEDLRDRLSVYEREHRPISLDRLTAELDRPVDEEEPGKSEIPS